MRRPERVAQLVREEIVQIVGYDLADPRVAGVTVTDVRMSDNLRDATVYVTIEGTEEEAREAMKTLQKAEIYVRRQLGLALELRHAPLVHFVRDTVEERATRIDKLLNELKQGEAGKLEVGDGLPADKFDESTNEGEASPTA